RHFRKYVPVAALVLSAIVTPTMDVVNQMMVAVPIVILFEVGLVGAWLAEGGGRTLVHRVKAAAIWTLKRLLIAIGVILLAIVAWQLIVAGMDREINIEDWHRFIEDVRRAVPFLR
ncbi:MAG: twin-arginine translocase subunit TatC, partial [Gemmatimonadaceae bacterium]|nr:twin-arginine translocase subunit TatC [Gemmatimonadaceae bacterium]